MRLLLDTQLVLWAASDPRKLSRKARTMIGDEGNALAFSAASIWEVAIKAGLGRSDFEVDAAELYRGLVANGYDDVPVTSTHAAQVAFLPPLHADPFDRILVAQARGEGMLLLTADPLVAKYGASIALV